MSRQESRREGDGADGGPPRAEASRRKVLYTDWARVRASVRSEEALASVRDER